MTGLYHARHRELHPVMGRPLQRDPLGFGAGDANVYRWEGNGTPGRLDPSGLDDIGHVSAVLPPAQSRGWTRSEWAAWRGAGAGWLGGVPTPPSRPGRHWTRAVLPQWRLADAAAEALGEAFPESLGGPTVCPKPPDGVDLVPVVGDTWEAQHYYTLDDGDDLGNGVMVAVHVVLAASDLASAGTSSVVKAPVKALVKGLAKKGGKEAVTEGAEKTAKEAAEKACGKADDATGQATPPCFAAGTPVRTAEGPRPIEAFRAGDRLLSRDERDPWSPIVEKVVTEVFARPAPVLNLRAGGKVIRTTAEHPFWAEGFGWRPAGMLEPGGRLLASDGGWVIIEGVADAGEVVTVYNFEVEDYHTYFVGDPAWWGFDLWTHNHNGNAGGGANGSRAGKDFTRKGKQEVINNNATKNGGSPVCENCGVTTVPSKKSKKGVTPAQNEVQVDHIKPKSKGGDGSPSNGQVLCRQCNRDKSNK